MSNYNKVINKIFWNNLNIDFFKFLKNFNISFFWLIIVNFVTFIINIFTARLLWVEDFWKINYILTISITLSVFILYWLSWFIIKKIKLNINKDETEKIFWNVIFSFLINSIIVWIVLYFINFNNYIKIDKNILLLSFFLVFFQGLKFLFQSFFQAKQEFKKLAITLIFESIFLLVFLPVILYLFNDYKLYIIILWLWYFFFSFISFFLLKINIFNFRFDKKIFFWLYKFSSIVFMWWVFWILLLTNSRYLIKIFLWDYELWIYSAYYVLSLMLIMQVFTVLNQVIIPTLNNIKYNKEIFNKIKKSIFYFSLPIFLFSFTVVQFWELFYWEKFAIDIYLKTFFSLNALLYVYNNFIWSTIVWLFEDWYKKLMFWNFIAFIISLSIGLLLIDLYWLYSLLMSTIVAFLLSNIIWIIILKNELKKNIIDSSYTPL